MEKKETKNKYIEVPVAWFESLIEYSNTLEHVETKSWESDAILAEFKGFISSAKTIVKYNKRADQ